MYVHRGLVILHNNIEDYLVLYMYTVNGIIVLLLIEDGYVCKSLVGFNAE